MCTATLLPQNSFDLVVTNVILIFVLVLTATASSIILTPAFMSEAIEVSEKFYTKNRFVFYLGNASIKRK